MNNKIATTKQIKNKIFVKFSKIIFFSIGCKVAAGL